MEGPRRSEIPEQIATARSDYCHLEVRHKPELDHSHHSKQLVACNPHVIDVNGHQQQSRGAVGKTWFVAAMTSRSPTVVMRDTTDDDVVDVLRSINLVFDQRLLTHQH